MAKNVIRQAGFTLIEMLLVTALLSIVGLSLYAAFANGIRIWQRINQESVAEDINILFDKLSIDLRNSFSFSEISFLGKEDEISFPTIILTGGKQETIRGPGRVNYFYDPQRKSLNKQEYNFSEVYQSRPGRQQEVAHNVDSVKFHYYYFDSRQDDHYWISNWPEEEISFDKNNKELLPLAVRVEIGVKDGNSQRKFTRTISVPTGCCQSREEH